MREQILAALSQYGSPALFGVVTIAAIGVPLPITLLLIVTGSLATQGVVSFWWAVGLATAGSVLAIRPATPSDAGAAAGLWTGSAACSVAVSVWRRHRRKPGSGAGRGYFSAAG